MDDNGRPDKPQTDQKPLDEGETSDDQIEEFQTPIIRRPLFNLKSMLPRGNDPSVFLQKEKEAAEAKNRNKTNPMFMTPSSNDPFKFLEDVQTDAEKAQTDAEKARRANEPRALLRKKLVETLLRPNKSGLPTRIGNLDRGGRRRSKKSDTKKSKNKYKSRSRSRISTKRKNKNRRQTRK